MAEFEESRVVQVPPERLFAVASDVERMPDWVPTVRQASDAGTNTVHLRLEAGDHETEVDARWRAEADQRRIEWSAPGGGDYTGWLQVAASGAADEHSEATIHLSFVGEQSQAHTGAAADEVTESLRAALEQLERLAES